MQPSLVIVYFGGNDSVHPHPSGLGPHVPLQEYVENMRKIANHIKVIKQSSTLNFHLSKHTLIYIFFQNDNIKILIEDFICTILISHIDPGSPPIYKPGLTVFFFFFSFFTSSLVSCNICWCNVFDTNHNDYQSLSEHIRLVFLTSPPINEEQIRKKLRFEFILFPFEHY